MRKIFIISFIFFSFFSTSRLWALPPTDIKIEYDSAAKVLHVSMRHVTQDTRYHYIRKIVVQKNDEAPQEFHFSSQASNTMAKQDVSMNAKPGDKIHVKAFCVKAGVGEKTFTIPAESSKPKDSSKPKEK